MEPCLQENEQLRANNQVVVNRVQHCVRQLVPTEAPQEPRMMHLGRPACGVPVDAPEHDVIPEIQENEHQIKRLPSE